MKQTYLKVGRDAGLDGNRLVLFVAYMKARWTDTEESKCRHGYAGEWAGRFQKGIEFSASDLEGQRLLDKLYKKDELYKRCCPVTWMRDNKIVVE